MTDTKQENNERLARGFLDDAINEAAEIIRLLNFYKKKYLYGLDQHGGSLKSKIDEHKKMIDFKIDKAREWLCGKNLKERSKK